MLRHVLTFCALSAALLLAGAVLAAGPAHATSVTLTGSHVGSTLVPGTPDEHWELHFRFHATADCQPFSKGGVSVYVLSVRNQRTGEGLPYHDWAYSPPIGPLPGPLTRTLTFSVPAVGPATVAVAVGASAGDDADLACTSQDTNLTVAANVPATPPVQPKYFSPEMKNLLRRYAENVEDASLAMAGIGAVMAVLALAPEPIITKGTVALWGVGVIGVRVAARIIKRMAADPPDPAYTELPALIGPSDAPLPRVRPTRRLPLVLAHRLDRFVRRQVRIAALALAVLQGLERASAAHLALAVEFERQQLLLVRRRAAALRRLLQGNGDARAAIARDWRAARLPNPRLGRLDATPLRAQLAGSGRRLIRHGFPQDLVDDALDELARDARTVPHRRLLRELRAPWLDRSEGRAASALGSLDGMELPPAR